MNIAPLLFSLIWLAFLVGVLVVIARRTPILICLLLALLTVAVEQRGPGQVVLLVGAALAGSALVVSVAGSLAGRRRI